VRDPPTIRLPLITLLHDLLLLPLQELANQSTNTMGSLLAGELDLWPLHALREDNGRAGDGSEVGVLLGGECTDADGPLELGGAEDGGIGLGDRVEGDLDFDSAFWDVVVRDGGRTSGEGVVDEHLVSEREVNGQFGRINLLAGDMLGKGISHIGTLEEMRNEEQAEQSKDDESEDTTTTGFSLAPSIIARRSIFSQTARSTAGLHASKETTSATTSTRVLFLSILLHGKSDARLLREKWRLLVV